MSRRLFLIVLIPTALVLGYVVSKNIFTFEYLNLYYSEISEYIENNYILSITGYVIIYFIVVLFCLPFAWFLTISGAILFGWIMGSILSVIAAGIGACAVFIIAKSIMKSFFKNKIESNEGMYNKFKNEINENAFFYLLSLRLMPVFPFVFINVAPAFFGIKFHIFAIATFVGIIPGSIVYSLLGYGAGEVVFRGRTEALGSLYSSEAVLGLIGLSIMTLVPIIIKKLKYLRRNK